MQDAKESLLKIYKRRALIFGNLIASGIKLFMLGPYWKDSVITTIIFFSFLLNLFIWIFLLNNKIEGNYPIILHYNLTFGVDYLGSYGKVFLMPLVGAIIFFFNTLLGYNVYKKEKLASYFLQFNALVIQAFLFFAGYLIVKVNS